MVGWMVGRTQTLQVCSMSSIPHEPPSLRQTRMSLRLFPNHFEIAGGAEPCASAWPHHIAGTDRMTGPCIANVPSAHLSPVRKRKDSSAMLAQRGRKAASLS